MATNVNFDITDDQLTITMQEGDIANGLDLAQPQAALMLDSFPTKDKEQHRHPHLHQLKQCIPHVHHYKHKDDKNTKSDAMKDEKKQSDNKSKHKDKKGDKVSQQEAAGNTVQPEVNTTSANKNVDLVTSKPSVDTTSKSTSLSNGKPKTSNRFKVEPTNANIVSNYNCPSVGFSNNKYAEAYYDASNANSNSDQLSTKQTVLHGITKDTTNHLSSIPHSQTVSASELDPAALAPTPPNTSSAMSSVIADHTSKDTSSENTTTATLPSDTAALSWNMEESESSQQTAAVNEKKKRVNFPEGQALIKGFALAPNPWYNVSLCTTNNLVDAYSDSCRLHGVRPIPKLVSQLKVIKDFGERINLLTLRGENLNSKHIETLEEIFRRVQFNTIDMEATHLDDEASISLFEMVEYYESAIHLKISQNKNLGMRAWIACARMIRKTPCLESLDVRGCSLNEQCMAVLGRALRMGAYVSVLHMQECNLACRGMMIMAAALRTISTVKEIHIGENNLQPSDGIQLGNLIRNNIFLHTLDIRSNHLQDVGLAHICDGLADQANGFGLRTLILTNNQITHHSMNALAAALARTRSLTSLNLSHNNLTNEGVFHLKEGLLKNKSLTRLSLRSTKMSCEGAVALAEFIADSYLVSQFDLRENDIKTAGLLALSMCLKVHQTVTRLELDQTVKKEQAVKDYQSQQKFFLDEIQTQVQVNAEIARSKLEKLLDRSTGQKNLEAALASGSATDASAPNTSAAATCGASSTVETGPEVNASIASPAAEPAVSIDADVEESDDNSKYFDPLGAVSLTDTSENANYQNNQPPSYSELFKASTTPESNNQKSEQREEPHSSDTNEAIDALGLQASMQYIQDQHKQGEAADSMDIQEEEVLEASHSPMETEESAATGEDTSGGSSEMEAVEGKEDDSMLTTETDDTNLITLNTELVEPIDPNSGLNCNKPATPPSSTFHNGTHHQNLGGVETADVAVYSELSTDNVNILENHPQIGFNTPPSLASLASSAVHYGVSTENKTESLLISDIDTESERIVDTCILPEQGPGPAMITPPSLASLASSVVHSASEKEKTDSIIVDTIAVLDQELKPDEQSQRETSTTEELSTDSDLIESPTISSSDENPVNNDDSFKDDSLNSISTDVDTNHRSDTDSLLTIHSADNVSAVISTSVTLEALMAATDTPAASEESSTSAYNDSVNVDQVPPSLESLASSAVHTASASNDCDTDSLITMYSTDIISAGEIDTAATATVPPSLKYLAQKSIDKDSSTNSFQPHQTFI